MKPNKTKNHTNHKRSSSLGMYLKKPQIRAIIKNMRKSNTPKCVNPFLVQNQKYGRYILKISDKQYLQKIQTKSPLNSLNKSKPIDPNMQIGVNLDYIFTVLETKSEPKPSLYKHVFGKLRLSSIEVKPNERESGLSIVQNLLLNLPRKSHGGSSGVSIFSNALDQTMKQKVSFLNDFPLKRSLLSLKLKKSVNFHPSVYLKNQVLNVD